MLRGIAGVIVGYVVMFVVVFATFTAAYLAMGADRAFQPGSYDVSLMWSVVSIVLGLVAAVAGGWVCAAIARGQTAPRVLAVLVLILGLLLAIPVFTAPPLEPAVRGGEVSNLEAMEQARPPKWSAALNPVIGAVGVIAGARAKGGSKRQEPA